jgi:predicted enzyme related to lactoylglutathione lyase
MKAGTRRLESSMSCPVVHFEIGSNDSAALSEFYATVFGWAFKAAGPAQAIVGGLDGGPSGMLNALGHPPEKYVMVYIEVPDLEACLERVNAAGGATIVPPQPLPNGGRFAWITDKAENMIGVLTPAP